MRILFTFGGLPHYYNAVLNALHANENLEIVVAIPPSTRTIGKGVKQSRSNIDFKIIHLEEYTTYYRKPFLRGLKAAIRREKIDVVVTIWPYILGFLYFPDLLFFLKKNHIKLIFKDIPFLLPKRNEALQFYRRAEIASMNEEMKLQRTGGWFFTLKTHFLTLNRLLYYRFIDAHVNYVEAARDLLPTYGVSKEKIFITYNSPDTDNLLEIQQEIIKLSPLLAPNPHRLIHVGRLVKWKRVDLIISVLANLLKRFPDAELLVIGTGTEEENLKLQAKELGVEKHVQFIGGVYDTRLLGQYLRASAVYVLAGMGGLSINEAMAFGKPVVCSVCDGTEKSLLRHGHNGYFFRQGDATSLQKQIERLFSQSEKTQKMGENSLQIIREEINIHTVIRGYLAAFEYCNSSHSKSTNKG